jgi:hypothetical protein
MSILTSYASQSARDSAVPASSNTGLCIFRSDTKAIEVSDGTSYLTYHNDGIFSSYPSNSYSAFFDATNDTIDTGDKFDFIQNTCNFSVVAWVKFTDHTSTTAIQSILGTTYTSSQKGFYLFYDNRSGNNNVLKVSFPSGSTATINVDDGITDNDWHHLAVTCAASGTLKLYKDGSVIGSTSAPSTTATTALYTMKLGSVLISGNNTNGLFGYMDEVGIFNRELTSTEIDNIRGASKTFPQVTSLYRFENNVDDETGTNNGTNTGATFVTSEKPY